jgi:hypothetical protein
MRDPKIILVVCALLVFAPLATASAELLLSIDNIHSNKFETIGFELTKPARLDIEAVGAKLKYNEELCAYAWIIDSQTRRVIWKMTADNSDRLRGDRNLRKVSTTQGFDKGKYELYYFAGTQFFGNITIKGTGDFFNFLGDVFGDKGSSELEALISDCFVKISSSEISKSSVNIFEVTGDLPQALLRFNKLGDSKYLQSGFSIDKQSSIRIYAIGECLSGADSPADYGWIINAKTRAKVWEMTRWNTRWAGGSSKNRFFDEDVQLPAGDYILTYVTDDSHSFPNFNANPPYDPMNWGITVLPTSGFSQTAFHQYTPPDKGVSLLEFTRARDEDFFEQPFKITNSTNLHIYAIGEYGNSDREFADYGWIQDAASGRIVWEMTYRNTEHAGGARKNRMFEGDVTLAKGDYILYYMTDDSHSYDDWNDSPPYDPKAWGITIYPGQGYRSGDLVKTTAREIEAGSNILVKLVGVRDDEHRREKFTLSKSTRIHIYAIGEGDQSEMFDYGWIIDTRTGRAVWEMTWRNTEPAGGARKNRLYDDDIMLDPGTYEVNYESDDSHSFNDWNSTKPRDPFNWGITVSVSK